MPEIDPIKLANSVTKSRAYFCHIRGMEEVCPKCNYREQYIIFKTNIVAKNVGTGLEILLEYVLQRLESVQTNISSTLPVLTWSSCIGIRFNIGANLSTIQHTFRIFQEKISSKPPNFVKTSFLTNIEAPLAAKISLIFSVFCLELKETPIISTKSPLESTSPFVLSSIL